MNKFERDLLYLSGVKLAMNKFELDLFYLSVFLHAVLITDVHYLGINSQSQSLTKGGDSTANTTIYSELQKDILRFSSVKA